MKKQEDDKLKGLFNEMSFTEPSKGFENRLMQQINIVAAEKQKKRSLRNAIYNVLAMIGGVLAIIALPVVVFRLSGINLADYNFSFKLPDVQIDPLWILMGFSVLVLLIGDTLMRTRLKKKQH